MPRRSSIRSAVLPDPRIGQGTFLSFLVARTKLTLRVNPPPTASAGTLLTSHSWALPPSSEMQGELILNSPLPRVPYWYTPSFESHKSDSAVMENCDAVINTLSSVETINAL